MTEKRVALDIGITYEMRKYNKYPEVTARIQSLAKQCLQRMDLDLTHYLTFGTSATYTDMDGDTVNIATGQGTAQQLFDTNHGLNGSSTTFRNRLANNPRLSKGALEGMERLIVEETYNQLGEKMTMPFDILWTTDDPNTVNRVLFTLNSL